MAWTPALDPTRPEGCSKRGFRHFFGRDGAGCSGAAPWGVLASPVAARDFPAAVPQRALSYAQVLDSPPAHLAGARFVYVRRGGCVPPLAPLYMGPYEVLAKHAKTFTLKMGDKSEVVSVDRLKPHTGTSPVAPAAPPVWGRPAAASRVQPTTS